MIGNDDPAVVSGELEGTPGDSLCGSISVHHDLHMTGRPPVETYRIDQRDRNAIAAALTRIKKITAGIEALRGMRIGLLGVSPDAFATTFANNPELFRLGFSLHTYELLDMWGDVALGGMIDDGNKYQGEFGEIRLANPILRNDERLDELQEPWFPYPMRNSTGLRGACCGCATPFHVIISTQPRSTAGRSSAGISVLRRAPHRCSPTCSIQSL
jgi:hypothetical protein